MTVSGDDGQRLTEIVAAMVRSALAREMENTALTTDAKHDNQNEVDVISETYPQSKHTGAAQPQDREESENRDGIAL